MLGWNHPGFAGSSVSNNYLHMVLNWAMNEVGHKQKVGLEILVNQLRFG